MRAEVEELFGGLGTQAAPRLLRAKLLVGIGVALLVPGMLVSAVPGAVLVLAGYATWRADRERVENGFLGAQWDAPTAALERTCKLALFVTATALVLQVVMLMVGVYDQLWDTALSALSGLVFLLTGAR